MRDHFDKLVRSSASGIAIATIALVAGTAVQPSALADEPHARELMQAMSDYMAEQTAIAFDYDASFEVITIEDQKLAIASSGALSLQRPDRLRATRTGGFADVEMVFDGETMTVLGKVAGVYAEITAPGTIDNLVDVLRDEHGLPLPAADLLLTDVYGTIMPLVVDVKDLGSGVIGGIECDHLAFRTEEVDFQIWIAHGDQPYPCRYVITTTTLPGWPQYTIDVRNWRTGGDVAADDYALALPSEATLLTDDEFHKLAELPSLFVMGVAQ